MKQLVASGPIGLIAAISLYVAYKKDVQCKEMHAQMLVMQEKLIDRYHGAISEVNKTVRALANIDEGAE